MCSRLEQQGRWSMMGEYFLPIRVQVEPCMSQQFSMQGGAGGWRGRARRKRHSHRCGPQSKCTGVSLSSPSLPSLRGGHAFQESPPGAKC